MDDKNKRVRIVNFFRILRLVLLVCVLGLNIRMFYHGLVLDDVPFELSFNAPRLWNASLSSNKQKPSRLQSKEIDDWLLRHNNTPGARLIHLLRRHLHYKLGAEERRIYSCPQKPSCFTANETSHNGGDSLVATTSTSVHKLVRYAHNKQPIPSIGTFDVCLPLVLAGQSVEHDGVIVELGPYVGFSTRCLGLGLNLTKREHALYAFDRFGGSINMKAIHSTNRWVQPYQQQHNLTPVNQDFTWLWRMAQEDVYPSAVAKKGELSRYTVHPAVWDNQRIAVLSLDSVKNVNNWHQQLAGLGTLETGTIVVLQDFILTDQTILVYMCLRDEYLHPVWTNFDNHEPWIFVILRDVDLSTTVCECLGKLRDRYGDDELPNEETVTRVKDKAQMDLDFMGDQEMEGVKNRTMMQLLAIGSQRQAWKKAFGQTC